MSEPASSLPTWVYRRDGRLVSFDPDRITLALFDASASFGHADPFLARELTDGVLHFLAEEIDGDIPTTRQIADVVAKVVRELGYPALAQVLRGGHRTRAAEASECLSSETEIQSAPRNVPGAALTVDHAAQTGAEVFSRDLCAAQDVGLISILGQAWPLALTGCVLGLSGPASRAALDDNLGREPHSASLWLTHALEAARQIAGGVVAVDGPEYWLASEEPTPRVAWFCEQLRLGARATGLRVVLNINSATPPAWASDLTSGPLFAGIDSIGHPTAVVSVAEALRDHCVHTDSLTGAMSLDWHLGAEDFATAGQSRVRSPLHRLARVLLERPNLAVTFDRPRHPHFLGPGLDRNHPTALLAVALHLPALLRRGGVGADVELFLGKSGSLAGMAVSAAIQKRAFLSDQTRDAGGKMLAVQRQFLLARARLIVVPVGLEAVARHFTGRGLCGGHEPIGLAQRLLHIVSDVLHAQATRANLEVCLSGAEQLPFAPLENRISPVPFASPQEAPEESAGLTPCDPDASLVDQLRAADALHFFGERATAALVMAPRRHINPDEFVELLRFAWRETTVHRLTIRRMEAQQTTLTGL
jgi:hypothetical protein